MKVKVVMANVVMENDIISVNCHGCNNIYEPDDLKAKHYMVGRDKYAKYFCPNCNTIVLSGIKIIGE